MKDTSRKGKKTKRLVPFVVSTSMMTAALFGTAGTSAFAADQTQEPKFKNHGAQVSFYAKSTPGSPEKGKLMRTIAHGDVQIGLPDVPGLPECHGAPVDSEQPGNDAGQLPGDVANPSEGSDTAQVPGDTLNPDDDGNTGTLPGDIEDPGNGSDDGSVPGNEAGTDSANETGTDINIDVTVE